MGLFEILFLTVFIIAGLVLIIKPEWGAKYLEYRMKVNLIQRINYNKIEDKEKLRKQLKTGSIILGAFIVGMGLLVLFII